MSSPWISFMSVPRFFVVTKSWNVEIFVERTIFIIYTNITKSPHLDLQAFFPRISMTEPALSSLAGPNPPNPVLAVRSGRRELGLAPLRVSLAGNFLTRLLVTSGILNMILGCGGIREDTEEASLRSPWLLIVREALVAVVVVVQVLGTRWDDRVLGGQKV